MHISKTFGDLSEMDIVYYGDGATFLRLRDTCSRYTAITFTGAKKQKGTPSDKLAHAVLTNRISFYGTPDIVWADKDSRFIGSELPRFCIGRKHHFADGYHRKPPECCIFLKAVYVFWIHFSTYRR